MQVLGLHFGGWPLEEQNINVAGQQVVGTLFSSNGGVPLWTLANDPLLQSVDFV